MTVGIDYKHRVPSILHTVILHHALAAALGEQRLLEQLVVAIAPFSVMAEFSS